MGRVLVVAWQSPEQADIQAVIQDLEQHHRRMERRLLYLSVIGPSALPTGSVRDKMVEFYKDVLTYCDSMHVVIEGGGFEMSIKRSVIANVVLVVNGRGRVFIENSLERVLLASPALLQKELGLAIRTANDEHFFDFARAAGTN